MIGFSTLARQHISAFDRYYWNHGRPEAFDNLVDAVSNVMEMINRDPDVGLPALRPYPTATRRGWLWVKSGRYWVAYRRYPTRVITAVFHDTANIPGRL